MSLVRVGLGENKKFGEGYDAIFGKKKAKTAKKSNSTKVKKTAKSKKK